jgi:hypothetical protein
MKKGIMTHLKYLLVAILLGIFANNAHAQKIAWATTDANGNPATYPQTGTVAKTIKIRGTITAANGYDIKDKTALVTFWNVGGGAERTASCALTGDAKNGYIITEVDVTGVPGFVSGSQYWGTLSITMTNGTKDYVVRSDPRKATAK